MKEWDGERISYPELTEDDFHPPHDGLSENPETMLNGTPVPSDKEIITDFLGTKPGL